MSAYQEQLIDIEGTRGMTCVDGWTGRQLQELTSRQAQAQLEGNSNPRLLGTLNN